MKYLNYFLSLLVFIGLFLSPSLSFSQEKTAAVNSFRDLPGVLRSQVQKQVQKIDKRGKQNRGLLQIGHLFLCQPYCSKVGHLYMAGTKGVQLRLSETFRYKRSRELQFVPRDSSLYIVFKNDKKTFGVQEKVGEAKEGKKNIDQVILSKGDDSVAFRDADSEYLLPYQEDRWGIYTSLQLSLGSRKVATENQIGSLWETPLGVFAAPRVEAITPWEFYKIRTILGVDYRSSLGEEGQGNAAGLLSSSVFGMDLSFLYRYSQIFFFGVVLRKEVSDLSYSSPSPQGFSTKSDLLWVGFRGQYRWFYGDLLYGMSNAITDELDYRGTAAGDSAFATTLKFCPYSFRLWIFESFPCGYVHFRSESQSGTGNPILPSLDKTSTTSISTFHTGLSFELGQYY